MKNENRGRLGLTILAILLLILLIVLAHGPKIQGRPLRVYYIPKVRDGANDFWTSLLEGAEIAAAEYNVELTILAPDFESDFEAQIRYIDEAIEARPDAILLSPASMDEITEAAGRIVTAGIRLVLVDSELNQHLQSVVVETDNRAAGQKMGVYTLGNLPENPLIGVVSHVESSSTARERLAGFQDGLEDAAGYITETVFCDSNYEKAYELTKELLEKHPGINVLACLNEYSAVGAARAVRDLGLGDRIFMVGFDNSIEEVQFLEEGVFDAIVIQKPFNIGYLGVENTVFLLHGENVPEMVDSGSVLITKENMYTEENQKYLFPFWK